MITLRKHALFALALVVLASTPSIAQTVTAHFYAPGSSATYLGSNPGPGINDQPTSDFDRLAVTITDLAQNEWVILMAHVSLESTGPNQTTRTAVLNAATVNNVCWLRDLDEEEGLPTAQDLIDAIDLEKVTLDSANAYDSNIVPQVAGFYGALALTVPSSTVYYGVEQSASGTQDVQWPVVTYPWDANPLRVNGMGVQNAIWSPTYGGLASSPASSLHMMEITKLIESAIMIQAPDFSTASSFLQSDYYGDLIALGGCIDLQAMVISVPGVPNPVNWNLGSEIKIKLTRRVRICIPTERVREVYFAPNPNPVPVVEPHAYAYSFYYNANNALEVLLPHNLSAADTVYVEWGTISNGRQGKETTRGGILEAFLRVELPADVDLNEPITIACPEPVPGEVYVEYLYDF